jgi:hypothetical protein
MMEQKSHPGPRRQVHHWKPKWKDTRITKWVCIGCGIEKKSTINFQGGFPTTVYRAQNGTEYGRAPACQPHAQPNIEECVIDVPQT